MAKQPKRQPKRQPKAKPEVVKDLISGFSNLPKYHLVMKFNDKVIETDTEDLKKTILENKPVFLKTKLILKIVENETGKFCEKMFFVFKGKQIFRNRLTLDFLVNNLIFK